MSDEHENTRQTFGLVLHTAVRVSAGMAGTLTNAKGLIADSLLTRNVITGLTLEAIIYPPERIGYPGVPTQFRVWDLPSVCMLARGIIEAYLALFHLAVDEVGAEQRNLRLLWWNWHELNERVWLLDGMASTNPQLPNLRKQRDDLVIKIKEHSAFSAIPAELKKPFLQDKSVNRALLTTHQAIAKAAGIDAGQFRLAYKYLSQFAHSLPMAVAITDASKPSHVDGSDSFGLPLQYATSYLMFTVRDFVRVFPDAKKFTTDNFWYVAEVWTGVHAADMKAAKTAGSVDAALEQRETTSDETGL